MSSTIHRFDPSTYDAKTIHKPLSQLMREAEMLRAELGGRMIVDAWKGFISLFRSKKSAPTPATDETRLAA